MKVFSLEQLGGSNVEKSSQGNRRKKQSAGAIEERVRSSEVW